MKIALVVPGGVDPSGEVRVIPALVALIGRLSALHEVHVFATHQTPEPGRWTLAGAQIHSAGTRRRRWRTAAAIVREHRARPFDVIHAFWAGQHGALAAGLGAVLRVPSIVHVAGGELAALADIGYGGCRTWRGRLVQRAVLRNATAVTCASEPIARLIAKRGVTAQRVALGVDIDRWPARAPTRRSGEEVARLVHVGSLNAVKDQPTLLRALRALADTGREFEADIVGEDTLGGRIQALADRLGLARQIRFHGFLTQSELRPIVEAAHVAVVTSRHEAGPVVVLEAALAGVPTVGTAVGHVAEWSPHAALAVPCNDSSALAAAIGELLDDEDMRLALARAAQEQALRSDADSTAQAFNEIYHELAAAPAKTGTTGRERATRGAHD